MADEGRTMKFENEKELERRLRRWLEEKLDKRFVVLNGKKVTDIIVCREYYPRAFFLEVKLHKFKGDRIGIGVEKGKGVQPEIVKRTPKYFEKYLRWVLCDNRQNERKFVFVSTKTIKKKYLSGGEVGQKYNNIKREIFNKEPLLTKDKLIEKLLVWLKKT